jgi:succinate-semialdehyde dehydrogenase/glutarate-semialdehyde dehydrogenase
LVFISTASGLNGEGRKGEDVINPATGKTLAQLPHASKGDLDAALAAAEKGLCSLEGNVRLRPLEDHAQSRRSAARAL